MLRNKRILDLTWVLGGPFAGQLLGQLGAEVIKVEPISGDTSREIPPYFFEGDSTFYLSANMGKKSVAIDLKEPRGLRAFYALVRTADAVLYGFAPDVPARLGIDYATLRGVNDRICVGQLIGIDDQEPYTRTPAYDIVIQALSGFMDITGSPDGPPVRGGYQVADLVGGLYLALGVSAALASDPDDTESRHVQVSLLDAQIAMLNWQAQNYLFSGAIPTRLGSRSPNIAPSEAFECADGRYVAVSPTGDKFWQAFCRIIGEEELITDSRFRTRQGRIDHVEELAGILSRHFSTKPAAEWDEIFTRNRIPAAMVRNVKEALEHPAVVRREMVTEIKHPSTSATLRVLGNPFKYASAAPPEYPSAIGADTRRYLAETKEYTDEDIRELMQDKVIH